jgi:heterodisulfide reductase subunit A-like polyferredoxin
LKGGELLANKEESTCKEKDSCKAQGEGQIEEEIFDLVVLSVGILPNLEYKNFFKNIKLESDSLGWIKQGEFNFNPVQTTISGVYAVGCSIGPKDIPDAIVEANAAVTQAMQYIEVNRESILEVER